MKKFLALLGLAVVLFFIWKLIREAGEQNLPPVNIPQASPTNKISFLVFGDSGSGSSQQKELAKEMLDYHFDFILHVGDIAYKHGTKKELEENFLEIYKEHLRRAPFYPAPGNHDYETNNLAPYLALFNLPHQALSQKDQGRYYSFDKSNVHFVSLDSNAPLNEISDARDDDMADWLEQDLDRVKDREKHWVVVYFHHSPYSSGKEHGEDLRVQQKLVPIFEKYNVDLVFSGHEHNYERTCKIRDNQCSDSGVEYIVTGGGGGVLYEFGPKKFYTASRAVEYEFVDVTVDGCRLNAEVIGLAKKKIDDFSLNKCS